MFSGLTFMSVINFEFVCLFFNVRKCPNFIVLHVAVQLSLGFHHSLVGKEFACSAGDLGLIPVLGRSPGRRHGNPLQYSCLENPHGQRSLAGYNPWGRKELDTTERLNTHILSWEKLKWKNYNFFPILPLAYLCFLGVTGLNEWEIDQEYILGQNWSQKISSSFVCCDWMKMLNSFVSVLQLIS